MLTIGTIIFSFISVRLTQFRAQKKPRRQQKYPIGKGYDTPVLWYKAQSIQTCPEFIDPLPRHAGLRYNGHRGHWYIY